VLRGSRGDAAGAELGSSLVEPIAVNTETVLVLPAPTLAAWQRAGPGRFPCSLRSARPRRSPALSLRHRHGYPAALHRGLPVDIHMPAWEFPIAVIALARHRVRAAPGPYPPALSRLAFKGRTRAGSLRTPLGHARRAHAIWQYWRVPALSGLLPPSPAPPGSGCPQLRRPAATGSAVQVSHLHSNRQRLTAHVDRG
jgi:hypothetical protein